MKKLTTLLLLFTVLTSVLAQIADVMEKRAREMHKAILSNDKEQWKKFISENYSQALIDKPMRSSVQTSDNGSTATSTTQPSGTNNIENKAKMFSQLNDDFGDSKISSLKVDGASVIMKVQSQTGMSGVFTLKFSKDKPYLIDGLGVEVEN